MVIQDLLSTALGLNSTERRQLSAVPDFNYPRGTIGRPAWAFLRGLGIVTSTAPAAGTDPDGLTVGIQPGNFPFALSNLTVRTIINEAAMHDRNDNVRVMLLAALGLR